MTYQDNIAGESWATMAFACLSILIHLTAFFILGNFCLPYITEFLFHHPYSFKVGCMVEGIPSEQKQLPGRTKICPSFKLKFNMHLATPISITPHS